MVITFPYSLSLQSTQLLIKSFDDRQHKTIHLYTRIYSDYSKNFHSISSYQTFVSSNYFHHTSDATFFCQLTTSPVVFSIPSPVRYMKENTERVHNDQWHFIKQILGSFDLHLYLLGSATLYFHLVFKFGVHFYSSQLFLFYLLRHPVHYRYSIF